MIALATRPPAPAGTRFGRMESTECGETGGPGGSPDSAAAASFHESASSSDCCEPAGDAGLRREHSAPRAEVLHRAVATLRRAPGVPPLRLPADLSVVPPELWAPLAIIDRLDDEPADTDPARLAGAIRAVAGWARRADAPRTALAVAAAGAELLAALPSLALLAGRAARALGQLDDAERWLTAAMRRAEAIRDAGARFTAARELVDVGREAARPDRRTQAPARRPARRRSRVLP
ncbi:MAG: hypothetical protein JWM27_3885 [Gemmatimonadetes bacterium]|nr:hypothetical protein [Gemmatimonadota bacterium]